MSEQSSAQVEPVDLVDRVAKVLWEQADDEVGWDATLSLVAGGDAYLKMQVDWCRESARLAIEVCGQQSSEREAKLTAEIDRLLEVRTLVAKLWCASGCSCCRDDTAWNAASAALGDLFDVPKYEDGSGYDWYAIRDAAATQASGGSDES